MSNIVGPNARPRSSPVRTGSLGRTRGRSRFEIASNRSIEPIASREPTNFEKPFIVPLHFFTLPLPLSLLSVERERRDRSERGEVEEGGRSARHDVARSSTKEGVHTRGSRIDMQQAGYAGYGGRTIRPPVRHHRVNYSPSSSV